MKRLLLLSGFGLLGAFAMANNLQVSNHTIEYAPTGGYCTVSYYINGVYAGSETSWQDSYEACESWAMGQYFKWRDSLPPMN